MEHDRAGECELEPDEPGIRSQFEHQLIFYEIELLRQGRPVILYNVCKRARIVKRTLTRNGDYEFLDPSLRGEYDVRRRCQEFVASE